MEGVDSYLRNKEISMADCAIPDLLALIPDTKAGLCVKHCIKELGLSIDEANSVLYDAHKLVQSMKFITAGRVISERQDR